MVTTKTSPKRGPYARTRKRRDEIAQVVLDIVDEMGHERVTSSLVSRRSATNEATVLYHFPSKDHLLVAALERADELTAERNGALEQNIQFNLDAFANGPRDSPARQRLTIMLRGQSATVGHPAFDYFRARDIEIVEIFGRIIKARQVEGLAHPGIDPDEAARQILALMEGLSLLSILDLGLDEPTALREGFRRLTGANWMDARQKLLDDDAGL